MEKDTRRETLFANGKNGYDRLYDGQWDIIETYCAGYKAFLDDGKTERDCVAEAVFQAESHGFREYRPGTAVKAGDKLYITRMGKAAAFAVIGERPLSDGIRMVAAHIDSPRLDLKPNPLYEDGGLALLKTHYYGGVKKYQWLSLPLELRGVVCTASGGKISVSIGADENDPVLVITDLLPHLAAEQMKKSVTDAFKGEDLNALIGSRPDEAEGADRVKLAVMALLNEKYGITESDFVSSELCLVPAGCARDVGLDRAMIGAYGHDDRSCAYAALRAIFDCAAPAYTTVCFLADKEEIGSDGLTGMKSGFFDMFIESLCQGGGVSLRQCYANSFCLSGDVCNALDPNFAGVSDKLNAARAGNGVGIFKYTGSRGKYGASDASAETMGKLRALLDGSGVFWQAAELGKVDEGGGGTVAAYLAVRDIEVVDCGVPVFSMHAPFEIVSKLDCYMMYKASLAVYGDR
ncbi:MAG: aminopeptidase [Oscillospiraceae bacterium]|jgi:aspartyl aminopeptidase|nr:aminopeptidase [Oscillospiraceae bacterium]